MTILTVNAGSSSVRLAGFRVEEGHLRAFVRRKIERSAEPPAQLVRGFGDLLGGTPDRIAHRVVHGGPHLTSARIVDRAVEAEIAEAAALAPLHNPIALSFIAACRARWPQAVEVAAFDTAFFAGLPEAAATYAIPRELSARHGLRRYGFHGLAHESMWRAHAHAHPDVRKVVTLQLGAGCSAAAIAEGRPIDTSMGLTPLEGLVMATRAGDVDPGLVTFLAQKGMAAVEIERMLDERSGLLGLSGASDLRALVGSEAPEAQLAVEIFCLRAKKYLGAYLAELGGADAVLFGGGVGEHQPEVRARILGGLEWCGLTLDPERNARPEARRLTTDGSRIEAWVVPVDEETRLAEDALAAS